MNDNMNDVNMHKAAGEIILILGKNFPEMDLINYFPTLMTSLAACFITEFPILGWEDLKKIINLREADLAMEATFKRMKEFAKKIPSLNTINDLPM